MDKENIINDFDIKTKFEPFPIFFEDSDQKIRTKIINSFEDIISLIKEINGKKWKMGTKDFSLEFQLWMHLAKKVLTKNDKTH